MDRRRTAYSLVGAALGVALATGAARAAAQVPDTTMHDHAAMLAAAADTAATPPAMTGPLGIPMGRMASGTTWIPDAVSLPSRHRALGSWELMVHGIAFLQYNRQGGSRGDDQVGSLNWAMLMASRPLAGGRFEARTMLSLDPATVTGRGYPLLLQTGEMYRGQPIRDRQHPHDFWMELAALYERAVTPIVGVSVYAAASGEPALGPVAFMHRPSALDDPSAPLSHHWQDATHVSFGVLTAGLFTKQWKLEGSWFNGREPDEHRWGFDRIRLDSWSGRLTLNPTPAWSLSAGYGHLDSPEANHPLESIDRATAGVLHGRKLGEEGQWASALTWGANTSSITRRTTHAFTAETEAILDRQFTIFGRGELVQKSTAELNLGDAPVGQNPQDPHGPVGPLGAVVDVKALSLGIIGELGRFAGMTAGLGVRGTVNFLPRGMAPFYGTKIPAGAFVFLRVRAFHTAGGMAGMEGMTH